jgi:CheY-like chemotaxis protein
MSAGFPQQMKYPMKIVSALVVIACAGLIFGCAASIPPEELNDARQAYMHATVGLAAELVPAELYRAREALAAAERSFQDDPASTRTRDLAYVAERKARLAEVLAKSAERKAATLKARGEYQTTLAAILANTMKTEARRSAAVNAVQSSLPRSKEAGPATKRAQQTLKQSIPHSGQYAAGEPTPVVLAQQRQTLYTCTDSSGGMRIAKILLVDDDRDRRDSVRRILNSTDYQVVEAADCENAIVLLGKGMFDLILLDFTLPGRSSVRLLEWLKQNQLTTRVIVVDDAPGLESAVKSATLAPRGYIALP